MRRCANIIVSLCTCWLLGTVYSRTLTPAYSAKAPYQDARRIPVFANVSSELRCNAVGASGGINVSLSAARPVGMRTRTNTNAAWPRGWTQADRLATCLRPRTSELSTGRAIAAAFHLGAAVSLELYELQMMEHTYLRPGLRVVTAGNAKMEVRSYDEMQRPVEGSKSRRDGYDARRDGGLT